MASRRDDPKLLAALAAVALSAMGWWFGSQFDPVWWVTWLAPLPILWLSTRVRAGRAAATAFVAVALGDIPRWHFGQALLEQPVAATLFMILGPALGFMLAVLLYRRLATRGWHLAAAFSVPAALTAIYYLNAVLSVNGTGGDLGYTQVDALAVIQVAALTGVWGIGFLVMLAPASVAVLCNGMAPWAVRLRTALVAGSLIVLALGYGAWRLHAAPAERGSGVKIGLVSLRGPVRVLLSSDQGRQLQQRYTAVLQQLAGQGAQIVVLPETVWAAPQADIPALNALARHEGITVLSGVDYRPAGQPERNVSLVFHPQGGTPAIYMKHHLVPGFEDRYTPGDGYTMLDGKPRIGLAICKDMDFPPMGRVYAARNTQLLLVPAWDFEVDDWLHSRTAILRGVESGFAIARAARDGRLTLSDDRGRVLAEASSVGKDAQVIGTLPLRQTQTLYARWGDWFAWLDLAGLVILLGLACWPRKRKMGW